MSIYRTVLPQSSAFIAAALHVALFMRPCLDMVLIARAPIRTARSKERAVMHASQVKQLKMLMRRHVARAN